MINGKVYDASGEELQGVDVLACRKTKVPHQVSGTTQGGLWYRQGIGAPSPKAAVILRVVGETTKDSIIDAWANGNTLSIVFDDMARGGFIIDEPAAELVKKGEPEQREYSITFPFGINSEEDLS